MEAILRVENLKKAFGGVVTAQDVSFGVAPGEIMGLIGPNGAGKTTMLNLISGIYESDGGSIWIAGKDVTKTPAHQRARMGLARTFQTPRFLQRSSVRDNLLLGTDLADKMGFTRSFFGARGNDFEKELDILMKIAGFGFDWDDDISSLPYGRRKLLEIVRALLTHPKIMLVDEPAAGLNNKELDQVVDFLEYAAGKNIGVILIEHRIDMVMKLCHNLVVLNFGKVIAYGGPEEISKNPDVIEAYLGGDSDA
jgi:ABC-type branched-subunit amino acid transport system ATPase component